MVSVAGGIVIAIVVLTAAAAVGWIAFTQYRARKLGLPAPSFSSYLPWNKRGSDSYGPPQPAPGGVVGWFNDLVRKFKNRNNRSAAGAYEPSNRNVGGGARGAHRALDPDEAWDTRVGNEADNYGYYEEELTTRSGGAGAYSSTEYHGSNSYDMNLAATPGRELVVNVKEDDLRSLHGKVLDHGGADAHAAAGNDDDTLIEAREFGVLAVVGHRRPIC
ncbi:hypothetical protein NQ176_g8430 [Zarea fungicola]|uniref:Uncharacterized protein n=1 Tax=Zarea fungicola TaxID=93591 RepID=A0ACC1MSV8_9HYPO|nr:hypothetical protein NQ176_g8430 [Lecanicillium fungicola]